MICHLFLTSFLPSNTLTRNMFLFFPQNLCSLLLLFYKWRFSALPLQPQRFTMLADIFILLLLFLTEDSNDITQDCNLFSYSLLKILHPGISFQNRAYHRRYHTMKSFSTNLIQSRKCLRKHISAFISFCSVSEVIIIPFTVFTHLSLYSLCAVVLHSFLAYCKIASRFHLNLFKKKKT